ncbi:FMRFamide receptor-like [Haliotis cracherodii]|uniref:FMRFamide receptor-like n=1 Tax=Haliotis cracherodii TaxID=6455 RepID=UPI0039EB9880
MANTSLTEITNITNTDFNSNRQQFGHGVLAWVSTIIAMCGVVGNILGAAVIHRMQKTTSGVRLLKYLSLTDVVLLLCIFLSSILPSLNRYDASTLHAIINLSAYLLGMALYTFEIYLTVLIATQRCIAIALPFKSGSFLRESVMNKALAAISVFTIVFNVPLWLAYWPQPYWDMNLNMQLLEQHGGFLGEDGFTVYIGPCLLVFRCIIPLILLVTCNIILMISRRRMNNENPQSSDRGSLTALVMAITTMSVVTHVFSAVDLFLMVIDSKTTPDNWTRVSICLIIINCSTNFIFYYSFGKAFRQNFKSCFPSKD